MSDTSCPSSPEALPGLNLTALAAFLGPSFGAAGDWQADLIAGGRSNLTYEVRNGSRSWIVRRPPLGHVLETAHDMGRECRVMRALAPTPVPVPDVLAYCAESEVLGAPFYVMRKVDGVPYRTADQLAELGPGRTRTICTAMIDVLAELHRVDPEAVGLSDFGRPQGFPARQVRRWKRQLDASRSRDLPAADRLYELLSRQDPPEQAPAIVHGDFRLDNLLVDSSDQVAAVIDWEMATLLGRALRVTPQAASGVIGQLVERGLLARTPPQPGLPIEVNLTTDGWDVFCAAEPAVESLGRQMLLNCVPPDRVASMDSAFRHVLHRLSAASEPPPD